MSVRRAVPPPSSNSHSNNMGGRNHDCRARDIKRRLEVIQKKMADLQELGVPCAFCHISIRNTGTLFTMGNKAMTDVIESCQDAILDQLSKSCSRMDSHSTSEQTKEVHMLLPPLPGPLDELGLHDLRALVVGIVKDLGIKWSNPRPPFWPQDIPFQYPRSVPDGFQGCWTKALRQIVRSIYTYFNYNPDTHTQMKRTLSVPLPTSPFPNHHGNHSVEIDERRGEMRVKEDEDVDVDISSSKENLIATYEKLSRPLPWADKPAASKVNGGNYTVISQSDDNDSNETISVCSDPGEEDNVTPSNEHAAVSYFGYEIANSESSRSSPRGHNDHDDASPAKTDTPVQPRLVYCDPRFYGQLYPTLQIPAPLLIQPNVFMKQVYTVPSDDATSNTSDTQKVESSTISPPQPLAFSFSLPKSTQPHTTHPSPQPMMKRPAFTHTPSPYEAKLTKATDLPHSNKLLPHSNKLLPHNNKLLPDSKSRKGKNGIYIYTNPTAPLKFMSLNSKKHALEKNEVEQNERKTLTATAPVSPNHGEPILMKDSSYHLQVIRPENNVREDSISPPRSGDGPDGSGGSRKSTGPLKRRRELVFHWYHSPETQGATTTKRPKSVDVV